MALPRLYPGLFARLQDGHWGGFAVAIVAAATGRLLGLGLQRRQLPGAAITIACATVSALVAILGLRIRVVEVAPATPVASVIYLIPGVALVVGVSEGLR